MFLKPQDVVLVISYLIPREVGTYAEQAKFLCMSASEVHAGVKRLVTARLLDPELKRPNSRALIEFLVHGVPYAYATTPGEFTRGIKTGWAAPVFKDQFAAENQIPPIWPHPEGNVQGHAIDPLFRNVPELAKKDVGMYDLLALVDTLRIGRAREKKLAEKELTRKIRNNG